MAKKFSIWKIIGLLFIIAFSLLIATDYINNVQYTMIDYDGGYNATVAANFARYGEYRVSYPSNIFFYNIITTGETVLLPTALIYKTFGINYITSYIVSIVYSLCVVWMLWILITRCLKNQNKAVYVVSAIAVAYLILSDGLYYYISTHLIGEIASLFFLLITFYKLFQYFEHGKNGYLIVSGAALITAFLTKSSMIFVVVSLVGILLFEMIVTKSINGKSFLDFIFGMLTGMLILEPFKIWQLGGITEYLKWWRDEWINMMNQSSGVDTTYSIWDKFIYLESIFGGCNKFVCALMLLLPVVVYFIFLYFRLRNKDYKNNGLLTMAISGICGSSLIIYFVLLGGSGLVYARRHEVNEILVRMFVVYFLIAVIMELIDRGTERKSLRKTTFSCLSTIVCVILITAICPWVNVKSNLKEYVNKQNDDYYSTSLMKEFINEIDELPENATLYTAGWWQEPNVTLFLDKKMTSIYEVADGGNELAEDAYFISGSLIDGVDLENIANAMNANLIRVDTSETDYNKYYSNFNRQDVENFAIYKVEPW